MPPELSLSLTQNLSRYAEAQAAYDAVSAVYPAHTQQAGLQSGEDLQASIDAGTLFDVWVSGEWAGYVGATGDTDGDSLGLDAYVVQEIILLARFSWARLRRVSQHPAGLRLARPAPRADRHHSRREPGRGHGGAAGRARGRGRLGAAWPPGGQLQAGQYRKSHIKSKPTHEKAQVTFHISGQVHVPLNGCVPFVPASRFDETNGVPDTLSLFLMQATGPAEFEVWTLYGVRANPLCCLIHAALTEAAYGDRRDRELPQKVAKRNRTRRIHE